MNAQYCPLFGNCDDGSIIYVSLNGYTNSSICSSGYDDYTTSVDLIVQPGQTPTLAATWDGFSDAQIYIWVDWDNNQVFDIGTESYFINSNALGTSGSTPLILPTNAADGDSYRMRLVLGSLYEPVDPCTGIPVGIFGMGEVEDYLIKVSDTPPPPPTDYCDATGTACDDYIDLVNFPGDNISINNVSGCEGYGNFIDQIADVTPGTPYLVLVSRFVNYVDATTTILIDWNDDLDFDDPDEKYISDTSPISTDRNVAVLVPTDAPVGLHRMRVAGGDINGTYCGVIATGEAEDYTIRVGNPVQCAQHNMPTDSDTDICTNGVTLTWAAPAAGPTPTGYKVKLGTDVNATNVLNGLDIGLVTSYTHPSGLQPNTTYYWQIIAYDANGDASGCDIWEFTTATNADPSIDQILLDGIDVDSAAVCADVDLAILANISGGTGTVDFAWTGDDIHLNDNSINNPTFNASTGSQTYTLRLTVIDDNTCTARDSVKVYVKDAPVVGTLSADKAAVCANETVTLTLAGYNATIADWEKAEGVNPYESVNHTQDVLATTINVDTQFKVLLTSGEGCEGESNQVTVTLKAAPSAPTIAVGPSNTACEGETITLTATPGTDVVWNDASNSTTGSIAVTTGGSYNVTYTDPTSGCSATSADETITFNAKPTAPVIEQSGDSLITNPAQVVNWLDAGGNVVSTGESYSPDRTPGQTFTAVVVDGNNCESFESNEVEYDHTVSIAVYNQIDFAVFPNPATSELNVQVKSSNSAGMYHIKDMAGRTVIAVELAPGINTISLAEIQSGVYMLQTNAGNTIRIVKQ